MDLNKNKRILNSIRHIILGINYNDAYLGMCAN